jgi:tellurite resistance protein TerC
MIETFSQYSAAHPWAPYAAFTGLILFLLFLDLGVFHKKDTEVSAKEATLWSAVWISLGLLFGAGIWHFLGAQKGQEYLAGFLLEKSLAVDNIFVFVMVFAYFKIEPKYQHRILFYGILGAIIMRGVAVYLGAALLEQFHWLMYVFGAFLIFTAIKMLRSGSEDEEEKENKLLRILTTKLPVSPHHGGGRFFIKENGKRFVTPLFITLLAIEVSDLVFAVDSIPAVFAVTRDPFIVFTSNIFAILGLRSLYFLSAELVKRFQYLSHGVAVVLLFVGVKMCIIDLYHIPSSLSLGIIALILIIAVTFSYFHKNPVDKSMST